MGNEKLFTLNLNKAEKVVCAVNQGTFNPEAANAFASEYKKIVDSINPSEYELRFDASNLRVNSQDVIPSLAACMEMYKKDGFKNIVFNCGTNATLKMQVRRVATNVGLINYNIL